mmetsp:Transcript_32420/g.76260  ORF Transcript_32420/g.76260 Transcript_32420/m.76260 type:complete len:86 (-) Transcript_32420:1017-1274(-)
MALSDALAQSSRNLSKTIRMNMVFTLLYYSVSISSIFRLGRVFCIRYSLCNPSLRRKTHNDSNFFTPFDDQNGVLLNEMNTASTY